MRFHSLTRSVASAVLKCVLVSLLILPVLGAEAGSEKGRLNGDNKRRLSRDSFTGTADTPVSVAVPTLSSSAAASASSAATSANCASSLPTFNSTFEGAIGANDTSCADKFPSECDQYFGLLMQYAGALGWRADTTIGGILNSVESALSVVPVDINVELPTLSQLRNVSQLRFCGYENCRPIDLCQKSANECGAQATSNFQIGSDGGRPLTCCEGSASEFKKRLCLAMFNEEDCDRFTVTGGFTCRRRRRRLFGNVWNKRASRLLSNSNPSTTTFEVTGALSDLNEAEDLSDDGELDALLFGEGSGVGVDAETDRPAAPAPLPVTVTFSLYVAAAVLLVILILVACVGSCRRGCCIGRSQEAPPLSRCATATETTVLVVCAVGLAGIAVVVTTMVGLSFESWTDIGVFAGVCVAYLVSTSVLLFFFVKASRAICCGHSFWGSGHGGKGGRTSGDDKRGYSNSGRERGHEPEPEPIRSYPVSNGGADAVRARAIGQAANARGQSAQSDFSSSAMLHHSQQQQQRYDHLSSHSRGEKDAVSCAGSSAPPLYPQFAASASAAGEPPGGEPYVARVVGQQRAGLNPSYRA